METGVDVSGSCWLVWYHWYVRFLKVGDADTIPGIAINGPAITSPLIRVGNLNSIPLTPTETDTASPVYEVATPGMYSGTVMANLIS